MEERVWMSIVYSGLKQTTCKTIHYKVIFFHTNMVLIIVVEKYNSCYHLI